MILETLRKPKATTVRWFTPEATARIQIDKATRAGHTGFAVNLAAVACGTAWGAVTILTMEPPAAQALAIAAAAGHFTAAALHNGATANFWATKHSGHGALRCLQDERRWRVGLVNNAYLASLIALGCTIASLTIAAIR
jgi:hypothetical protein